MDRLNLVEGICKPIPLKCVVPVLILGLSCVSNSQLNPTKQDPTATLRRFPITILVKRTTLGSNPISILHVNSLRPGDDVLVKVDEHLKGNWTLVSAIVGAGQKIRVRTWNLWDKRITKESIDTGIIPDADVVPLYFLVLNKPKEHRVFDGIRHSLETAAEQIVSQTAIFQTKYTQQNRLLNFMTAYAYLGPRSCPDPKSLKDRIDQINYDLGSNYDPSQDYSSPGQLQHGLDAGVGILDAMRTSPDNPVPAAAIVRSQLPSIVSDWVSLVGDLMHVFIKPPHDVKFTFIPASAIGTQVDAFHPTDVVELVTQRVPETTDGSLPTIVYRPQFVRQDDSKPIPIVVSRSQILAGTKEIAVPLGQESRELFESDYAWGWEASVDGSPFSPLSGAHLVPGRGLVFPISQDWWGNANEHTVYLRAHVGFEVEESKSFTVARVLPQTWIAQDLSNTDCASGDPSVAVKVDRTGPNQPFFRFGAVYIKDSSGKIFSADSVSDREPFVARFNLSSVSPGPAQVYIQQESSEDSDRPVTLFVAPKHPSVSLYCGRGDKVLRVTGPDANWVKGIKIPSSTIESEDQDSAGKSITLNAPLSPSTRSAEVTYRDPQRGLEWTQKEPIAIGNPRPGVNPMIMGELPSSVQIGAGADPSWATADLPAGWLRTNKPIRLQLSAVQPFTWSHDISLDLGFGSAGDVQTAVSLPEGPVFTLDTSFADAYATFELDTLLLPVARRNSGLMWVKLSRSDLASPWTLVKVKTASGLAPARAVKLPTILAVNNTEGHTVVTLANADQVLGIRFAGQTAFEPVQLTDSIPGSFNGTASGPANATEFDLQFRDSGDEFVHVKISKPKS